MAEVIMPQLGETVTEGTVTKWLKSVGEAVARDEPLFEVSTDKVDSEVPSPAAGTLAEIRVQEGETVDVGTVLAVLSADGAGGGAPAEAAATASPAPPAPPAPSAPAPAGCRRSRLGQRPDQTSTGNGARGCGRPNRLDCTRVLVSRSAAVRGKLGLARLCGDP